LAALYPSARGIGFILVAIGVLVMVGTLLAAIYFAWQRIIKWVQSMGAPQIVLLLGIAGTWFFMTMGIGALAWMLLTQQGFAIGRSGIGVGDDEGPLQWVYNFGLEGGFGRNIFALTFRGANTSKTPVQMKEANIISLIDGTLLPLEIVALDPVTEENKVVSLDKVQLIPPGAPIQLVAKFGPADLNASGKVLGLDSKTFLEKWRQFSFNVKDESRSYRLDFNENSMMPFFQGQVGPRVVLKP
jgi:hypothetical protein